MRSDVLPTFTNDMKHSNVDNEKGGRMLISASTRRNRSLTSGFAIVAFFYFVWSLAPSTAWMARFGYHIKGPSNTWEHASSRKALVPLEAHIMSKCPDARDCLKELVLPTMQRVHDKVNFTLSYIGTPTNNDGVACMHGPEECMGNIIELCAASIYPDPKIYLGFTMCLSNNYKDIPQHDLVADCALEHGIDVGKLNECAVQDDGGFGVGMLRDSVRRSRQAGVTKSCTIRLDEKFYCIRDDGKWSDCPNGPGVNDLVIAIEKLFRSS